MSKRSRTIAFHLVTMLALCLQAVLPGAFALAQGSDVDVSPYICSPSGSDQSVAAQEVAKIFADLLDDESDETQQEEHHCPLCTLSDQADGVTFDRATIKVSSHHLDEFVSSFETRFVHRPNGPPLGSRGPPSHT